MAQISQLLYDGYQHQLRGQFEEAARIYRKILRAEPGNADVLILLGIVRDSQFLHERGDRALRQGDPLQARTRRRPTTIAAWRSPSSVAIRKRRPRSSAPIAAADLPEALGEYAARGAYDLRLEPVTTGSSGN